MIKHILNLKHFLFLVFLFIQINEVFSQNLNQNNPNIKKNHSSKGNPWYDLANDVWSWHLENKDSDQENWVFKPGINVDQNKKLISGTLDGKKNISIHQIVPHKTIQNLPASSAQRQAGQLENKNFKVNIPTKNTLRKKVRSLSDNIDVPFITVVPSAPESKISKLDYFPTEVRNLALQFDSPKRLDSPSLSLKSEIAKIKNKLNLVRLAEADYEALKKLAAPIKESEVNKIKYSFTDVIETTPLPSVKVSTLDVLMYSAIILYNKKQYTPALGLFNHIVDKKSKAHKNESTYLMGKIAYDLKLFSESAHRLIPLVQKANPYRKKAIAILLREFPKEHESRIALAMSKVKNKELFPQNFIDKIVYYIAKHQFEQNQFSKAALTSDQVDTSSKYYNKSRFLKGLSQYLSGKHKQSLQTLSMLKSDLDKKVVVDKNLANLVNLNLARVLYQLKKYTTAHNVYKQIDKSHPLWVQALTELGWVQLSLGDQFGAIGNMYSLHSPYFQSVYKPETFSIRTIGYLSICQYADAYKSLTRHEKVYRNWQKKVNGYYKTSGSPFKIYNTVAKYLTSKKSTTNTDGLPYQVIREIARQKSYLNIQSDINSKIDESGKYSKVLSVFNLDIASADKKAEKFKANIAKIRQRYEKAKLTDSEKSLAKLKKEYDSQMNSFSAFNYKRKLYSYSKKTLQKLKKNTQKRIKEENNKMVLNAGKILLKQLKLVKNEITELLDANELLRYEVFSGSGETIRYQVTGGEVKNENRIPASVKPKKSQNWDFDGEYWEDEIGSYRTTLVDKCPKNYFIRKNIYT